MRIPQVQMNGRFGYNSAGYNFRESIMDPNSQLREVIEIVRTDRVINRFDYYMETRVHKNGDWRAFRIVPGTDRTLQLRPGYGSSFWSALCLAGILKNTWNRAPNGYCEYVPGPRFNFYVRMINFFQGWDT